MFTFLQYSTCIWLWYILLPITTTRFSSNSHSLSRTLSTAHAALSRAYFSIAKAYIFYSPQNTLHVCAKTEIYFCHRKMGNRQPHRKWVASTFRAKKKHTHWKTVEKKIRNRVWEGELECMALSFTWCFFFLSLFCCLAFNLVSLLLFLPRLWHLAYICLPSI